MKRLWFFGVDRIKTLPFGFEFSQKVITGNEKLETANGLKKLAGRTSSARKYAIVLILCCSTQITFATIRENCHNHFAFIFFLFGKAGCCP